MIYTYIIYPPIESQNYSHYDKKFRNQPIQQYYFNLKKILGSWTSIHTTIKWDYDKTLKIKS